MNVEFTPEELRNLRQALSEVPFKYVAGIIQFLEIKEQRAIDAAKKMKDGKDAEPKTDEMRS